MLKKQDLRRLSKSSLLLVVYVGYTDIPSREGRGFDHEPLMIVITGTQVIYKNYSVDLQILFVAPHMLSSEPHRP